MSRYVVDNAQKMSGVRLFCITFIWACFSVCDGITNYDNEKNLIGEEDRRGVIVKEGRREDFMVGDQEKAQTKRGLWLIGQHQQPSEYDSSGAGGYGYVDSGAYGGTGSGYNFGSLGSSTGGGGGYHSGYHKGPSFGNGYGYSGGGSNFGYGGVNFGHSGYEETGHGSGHVMSHGGDGYNKLALKKLLIPLAGLAILGAAAALSTNPVLLQLGSIQSGRRKRSITTKNVYPSNPWAKPKFRK